MPLDTAADSWFDEKEAPIVNKRLERVSEIHRSCRSTFSSGYQVFGGFGPTISIPRLVFITLETFSFISAERK